MNWINISISFLVSISALILAGNLIVRIQRSQPVSKPIVIKPDWINHKPRY